VTVEGGDLFTLPLVVASLGGRATLRAGVTASDEVPATMEVDDVVFDAQ
jgi:hypothetical protein